eukprot:PhF_6_TR28296/c0_g1_i2/m.41907/K06063/SNW1, SKIIP, SKIP; SNW domain-containing protein 1
MPIQVAFPRPPQHEIEQTIARTKAAIDSRLVQLGVVKSLAPSSSTLLYLEDNKEQQKQQQYADPLQAPKKQIVNIPVREPSPPRTVERSPPRALTKEQKAELAVPISVSNYINPKGHIVSLDVRSKLSGSGTLNVGESHAERASFMDDVEARTKARLQQRAIEQQLAAEKAAEEQEELARKREKREAYLREQKEREARKKETPEERAERVTREKRMREIRAEIHHKNLREEAIRKKTGLDDVGVQRSFAENVALQGQDGILNATVEGSYDSRIYDAYLKESDDQGSILPPSSGIFAPVFRQDIAREMEVQVMAETGKVNEEIVFQQEGEEEDVFGDVHEHLGKRRKI